MSTQWTSSVSSPYSMRRPPTLSDAHHIKLSSDQKLAFYGLFKQATVGPCDKPQPGLLEMVERAKWKAWKALGRMSKDEAVVQYVKLLDKIAPQWKEELGDMEDEDEEERKKRRAEGRADKDDGLDIAPAVSRPVHEPDTAPITADLCHFAASQRPASTPLPPRLRHLSHPSPTRPTSPHCTSQ